jgi:uncharacterized protein
MFLNVKELELRKIRFQTSFPPGKIEFLDAGIKQVTPLGATGVAELVGAVQEIRVRGHLRGAVECGCDRCLEPMRLEIDGDFDLFYRPADGDWGAPESGLTDDEAGMGFYEGSGLELSDVVREQVLLWIPMQRVCRPDCMGMCPQCGRNRNAGDCGCRAVEIDDRWRALKEL